MMHDDHNDPLQTALSRSLAEHAHDAPDGDLLVERVMHEIEHRAQRDRRPGWRTWTFPLIAAGATAAIIGTAVGLSNHNTSAPAPHPPVGGTITAPTSTPNPSTPPAPTPTHARPSTAHSPTTGSPDAGTTHTSTAARSSTSAVNHVALAHTDWVNGSKAPAATENEYWTAARTQLAHDGDKYRTQRDDLTTLISIPETDTTATQRADAQRATRELNTFFHTPGLYGVTSPPSHYDSARQEWIKGSKGPAATENEYWTAARTQLAHDGDKYRTQRDDLTTLISIPETDTTATQRADAQRATRELDTFFHTPGLYL